jgi:hypothetical protein
MMRGLCVNPGSMNRFFRCGRLFLTRLDQLFQIGRCRHQRPGYGRRQFEPEWSQYHCGYGGTISLNGAFTAGRQLKLFAAVISTSRCQSTPNSCGDSPRSKGNLALSHPPFPGSTVQDCPLCFAVQLVADRLHSVRDEPLDLVNGRLGAFGCSVPWSANPLGADR